jgi:tetratricopeptide (TPR) repeat protein
MRKALFLVVSVAFVVATSGPVIPNDRVDCFSNDVDRIIRGCTEVINGRPDLSQRLILPVVYHRRGTAYASKKEYDRAIADYTKAIEIDPQHVGAYNDRGIAYTNKGDYENAIADVTRAVELTRAKPTAGRTTIAATPPPTKTAKSAPSASTKTSAIAKAQAPAKTPKSTPPPSEFPGIPRWATPILNNEMN